MLPTRYVWSIPLWLCYVDDTVTAVHKDEIDDFHEHLNRRKVDIKFSKEIEENGKIPFLDRLVTCNNKNDYNTDFVRRNTHSNTDTNTQTNVNSGSVYDSNYTVQRTKALLKLLHVYYNPSIQVLHTSRYPFYEDFLLMSRTKINWRTDREQYIQDQMLQLPSFLHW